MIIFEDDNGLEVYTIAGKKNVFVGLTKADAAKVEEKKAEYGSYAAIPETFEVNTHSMVMNPETGKYLFDVYFKMNRKMNELEVGFLEIQH